MIDFPSGKFAAVLVQTEVLMDAYERRSVLTEGERRLKCLVVLYDLPAFGDQKQINYFGGKEEWHQYLKSNNFFSFPSIPMP